MKPYPLAATVPSASIVLDPDTQTGRRIAPDGTPAPSLDRHKRSQTSKETSTTTSLDGNTDQGSDQQGDTD